MLSLSSTVGLFAAMHTMGFSPSQERLNRIDGMPKEPISQEAIDKFSDPITRKFVEQFGSFIKGINSQLSDLPITNEETYQAAETFCRTLELLVEIQIETLKKAADAYDQAAHTYQTSQDLLNTIRCKTSDYYFRNRLDTEKHPDSK